MERTEKIGLSVATAGHILLFGLLSTTFLGSKPLKLNSPPVDVSMVDEIDLKSMGPKVSFDPPPPSRAPEKGPTEEAAPAPAPEPEPEVAPTPPPPKPAPPRDTAPKAKPNPKPAAPPKEEAKPKVKETPKQKAPAKPAAATGKGTAEKARGSLLGPDFLKGIQSDSPAKPKANATPAASIGPAQKAALDAEIRRQIKPYWKAPTGADVELLRTFVIVNLNRDGSISGTPEIDETTGQTASNRSQVPLHQEQAIKAIRLAAPFKLPADLYDSWRSLRISFDKRLSQ